MHSALRLAANLKEQYTCGDIVAECAGNMFFESPNVGRAIRVRHGSLAGQQFRINESPCCPRVVVAASQLGSECRPVVVLRGASGVTLGAGAVAVAGTAPATAAGPSFETASTLQPSRVAQPLLVDLM
jgi:hypothetical protein